MRTKLIPPHKLLDELRGMYRLDNDAQLATFLTVTKPCISKIRHRVNPISSNMLIKIHEVTGISIKDLKAYSV